MGVSDAVAEWAAKRGITTDGCRMQLGDYWVEWKRVSAGGYTLTIVNKYGAAITDTPGSLADLMDDLVAVESTDNVFRDLAHYIYMHTRDQVPAHLEAYGVKVVSFADFPRRYSSDMCRAIRAHSANAVGSRYSNVLCY